MLKALEQVINARGFVEFRPTLSMILDRLETKSFEIALFGRVSSGKSSLLNHMIQSDILPVGVNPITAVKDLAQGLAETLASTAQALGFNEVPSEGDLVSAIQEMPRLDIGTLQVDVRPNLVSKISAKAATRHVERSLGRQIGPKVAEVFSSFGSLLNAWTRRTLAEIQLRFESHADGYRAHLGRIKASGHLSGAEAEAMEMDLQMLARSSTSNRRALRLGIP